MKSMYPALSDQGPAKPVTFARSIRVLSRVLVFSIMAGLALPALANEGRYLESDALFGTLRTNVAAATALDVIVEIDHSRLAEELEEDMPPSRVLIFSDPALEAGLLQIDPRIGIDLPLRILSFEDSDSGESAIIYNSIDYIAWRYGVTVPGTLRADYEKTIRLATAGIAADKIASFPTDDMTPDGLVVLESPHSFDETLDRLRAAVDFQDDTVWFGEVDFTERSGEVGADISPTRLFLFGGPGPGGRAMANAPSLGLDAFCQKLLVIQDADGSVRVLFNDLLALADRQDVPKSIPLRVINRRLKSTFTEALEE